MSDIERRDAQGEDERALELLGELMSYDNFEAYPPYLVERVREYMAKAEALRSRLAESEHWPRIQDTPEWQAARAEVALAASEEKGRKADTYLIEIERVAKKLNGYISAQNMLGLVSQARYALASERAKREGEDLPPHMPYCRNGCGPCRDEPGPWHQRGCTQWCETVPESPAPDATALRVCGNCKHGQPTSLDDTRCYKATPYLPVDRWAIACADWEAAPTCNNPRAALLRSEPRGEEGRG